MMQRRMKIGIDIVSIKKFRRLTKSDRRFWLRVFTAEEWEYAFRDAHAPEHLAGIFAAKEAAMKATGKTGVSQLAALKITHAASGAPAINVKGAAVSIAHDRQSAVAVVLVDR